MGVWVCESARVGVLDLFFSFFRLLFLHDSQHEPITANKQVAREPNVRHEKNRASRDGNSGTVRKNKYTHTEGI